MRKAFTLIELLVVISIIALLIAILLPALSSAKYQANITKCQIAVRSIAMVQISYATDNKEYFAFGRPRYDGGGNWVTARDSPQRAQIRSWEIFAPGANGYDLRPIYYDYMQNNNQENVMHCPMKSDVFFQNNQDDRILSYMMYASNNHRLKHFEYDGHTAYERLGDTWSPRNKPNEKFTLLASDFVLGRFAPHGKPEYTGPMVTHPSPKGSMYEHFGEINDFGGHILDPKQESPNNFADADGSVHTYKVNVDSINDTDTWVVNNQGNHRNVMMPRDLAR